MPQSIVTIVDAQLESAREAELLEGYRRLTSSAWPEGLLRTELLRGQNGAWRVASTWRDKDAVIALRATGVRPAALMLFESLGATQTHAVFTVEQAYTEPAK